MASAYAVFFHDAQFLFFESDFLNILRGEFKVELNRKQLAEVMDLSIRQIDNLRVQGIFEHIPGTKKYNLAKCVQEYIQYKTKPQSGSAIDKERESAEHERYKKELTKLKLRKARSETHEAAYVEEFLLSMLSGFRSHLLSVPGKIAPELIDESDVNVIIKKLNKEMLETLAELSGYDPDKFGGNDSAAGEDEEPEEPEENE